VIIILHEQFFDNVLQLFICDAILTEYQIHFGIQTVHVKLIIGGDGVGWSVAAVDSIARAVGRVVR